MAQHNDNLQKWLAAAVAGIRFRPDRAAVEQELREHIEDKTADLLRIFPGMTEAEAEERALSGMGDPEEVGRELAKIHRPWLGYLWQFSRVLPKILLAVLAVSLLFSTQLTTGQWFYDGGQSEELLWQDGLVALEPDGRTVALEGDWITMERAVLDRENRRVGVELRLRSPFFWEENTGLRYLLSAVDDRGGRHPSYTEFWADGLNPEDKPINFVLPQGGEKWPFRQDYIFWIQEVNPAARWLRLEYDWMGRQFDFVIDLEVAEG